MSQVITTTPLTGRVVVVTGASSGIGEATAERLARLGAKVAVAARRKEWPSSRSCFPNHR